MFRAGRLTALGSDSLRGAGEWLPQQDLQSWSGPFRGEEGVKPDASTTDHSIYQKHFHTDSPLLSITTATKLRRNPG